MITSQAIKRMDVVIIDDSQRIRSLMAALLRDLGCYSVRPFESVNEACVDIENARPSLVLCDWLMEGAGGSVFLDRIRCHTDEHIARTPVIIVTGHGSRDILVEAMQKGATQFLVKPVVPHELLKKMGFAHNDDREIVRRNGRMIYLKSKPVAKPKSIVKTPVILDATKPSSQRQKPVSTAQADADVWEL